LGDDHTVPLAALGHFDFGGHRVRFVLHVQDGVLAEPTRSRRKRSCVFPVHKHRSARDIRVEALDTSMRRRRRTLYLTPRSARAAAVRSICRDGPRQVVGLRPVGRCVVELPHVVVECWEIAHRTATRRCGGLPQSSLVVDAAVAGHLEVLGLPPFSSISSPKAYAIETP